MGLTGAGQVVPEEQADRLPDKSSAVPLDDDFLHASIGNRLSGGGQGLPPSQGASLDPNTPSGEGIAG